ncbi:hypothetical protein SEPCBS57363_003407 [Sporothrix epigloea]|uniref:Tmem1 family n=1 Tax=Sporothrix epigloea TaxID=1892477 RepID=A0ABP0DL91_9PEZI
MEPFSTSKVSVEYHDPNGLYRLLEPGLAARLPLRHLHWQSHLGPLRSIDTLHVELVSASTNLHTASLSSNLSPSVQKLSGSVAADDGFQTATIGEAGFSDSGPIHPNPTTTATASTPSRRHQFPGLRRTPYLKLLLVRCDDIDTYKAQTRAEIKDWLKKNTTPEKNSSSSRKRAPGVRENHDAFEWMIVHVVLPNSPVYSQPRISKGSAEGSDSAAGKSAASRWGKNTSTLLERLRSDFNLEFSSKSGAVVIDRVAQIRATISDVSLDMLPKATPTTTDTISTSGISASENDGAWADVIDKLKSLILASFDVRVSQYEDDIREKDVQRKLPGWNFCTFFILKEGLARDFESVGLVEDALVGYDELSVGLDTVLLEQASLASSTLLKFTETLKEAFQRAPKCDIISNGDEDDDTVDLQATSDSKAECFAPSIPISATKKAYRELILANNVSVFDFRCYVFARQVALLLRLGNAAITHDELLHKMQEQMIIDADLSAPPSTSLAPATPKTFAMLAEICRRTLEFIPIMSRVMREDLHFALTEDGQPLSIHFQSMIDDTVASFAFSIAQQILAQTSTCALPIPLAMVLTADIPDPKVSIAEPKTMMHPARTTLPDARSVQEWPSSSPNVLSASDQLHSGDDPERSNSSKLGLVELAARRADLYLLSRNVVQKLGEKRGWYVGWSSESGSKGVDFSGMEDVNLDDSQLSTITATEDLRPEAHLCLAGVDNIMMRNALESRVGFIRLYEVLTDKAIRHYTVAGQTYSAKNSYADLAALKYYLRDYVTAVKYFHETVNLFDENCWGSLELPMLLMCAKSLKELGRQEEYAQWLLWFLTKAADVERQRRKQHATWLGASKPERPATSSIHGQLSNLLEATRSMPKMSVPLTDFFQAIIVDGSPVFADGQDRFTVSLRLESLLVDPLPVDSFKVRLAQSKVHGSRVIWLELSSGQMCTLSPGWSTVKLHSNTTVPGLYEIDQVLINSRNLVIFSDRLSGSASKSSAGMNCSTAISAIFPNPHVVLYQRTDALDVQLSTSKDLQLDKNNHLELALLTGWNDIQNCEMCIRAATGGLRLITTDAKVLESTHAFSVPLDGGIIRFDAVSANSTLRISFPFSIEQDVLELCLKVDVTYKTRDGIFHFSKSPSVSTSLPLGVNVQDVFKHDALFSRFTVSTATSSPLRVFHSELLESDQFKPYLDGVTSSCGVDHGMNLPVIFPKQPISLLYKIVRKPASFHNATFTGKYSRRTMYIKLQYSVFQDQLDVALESSLGAALREMTGLRQYAKVVVACVLRHMHASLTPYDLERIALLHEIQTSILAHVHWAKEFYGLSISGADLAAVIYAWQKRNPVLHISSDPSPDLSRTILIPVDIPSITIVHTADIQLQKTSVLGEATGNEERMGDEGKAVGISTVCVNQLLPATLHLRWTRIWDTSDMLPRDLEFSFDVSAPNDAWLIGGRRKGHFVIPAPVNITNKTSADDKGCTINLSSTPALEATIPIVLIPLREGRLCLPNVDIREVVHSSPDDQEKQILIRAASAARHCETDYRNLGETVHVLAERKQLTVSLDASEPNGGLLVLESIRAHVHQRFIV